MTLHLHTGERTDLLADALGDLLSTPLADPFAREVVVVPARGVERWLTQRLSHRLGVGGRGGDGVCAGVDFVSPHSLVSLLLDRADDDPWSPDRLAWPVLETIDEVLGEPGFETLSRHLGHDDTGELGDLRRSRRYSVARRLAGLLASYGTQRPSLLTDWREGRDHDGEGAPLPDDLRWQAELWRRLLLRVEAAPPDVRLAATTERLRSGDVGDLALPPRLSLFGHTRLPVSEVSLLEALGALREVHLWLPQTSVTLWDDLAPAAHEGPVRRAEDRSPAMVHHPLLASLGRDTRELRRTLGDAPSTVQALRAPEAPDTLLGWLQHDLRANAAPDPDLRATRTHADGDHSVQVHACHGAARQVDVLREVLVGLLESDPTLEPRDILVMCPDIESYAPLISAAFGLADVAPEDEGHPAHTLRVRLADRSPGATNPLLALGATLVDLVASRLTATEVLDLATAEPVRARFGFDDDALERITQWVGEAAVRWGLDAADRGRYGLTLGDNTWLTGLQRLLLGVAVSGDGHRTVGATLPVDDVGDADLELLGRFREFVDRLQRFLDAARQTSGASEWARAIGEAVHSLTTVPLEDTWQRAQFDRELARITAAEQQGATRLRHADVRALFRHRLRSRPTRANFRTGTLTVCTMVPMRSVPHRVVCLVGLDDGVFPRVSSVDGDDALGRAPMTGERDLRSEDRQLLLDAVGAATQTLVVTYSGRGEHTGETRPPAVPLGELLSALDGTTSAPVLGRVLVHHPLQPYDESNLVPDKLGTSQPFSFDRTALRGAEAARDPRPLVRERVPEPLPLRATDDVSLADLHDFFTHPVRTFFRSRLRVSTPAESEQVKDAIPIALDNLEQWAVGDRLVRDILSGAAPQQSMLAEQLRGLLPPGELGRSELTTIVTKVRPLYEQSLELRRGAEARTVDVVVDLGGGRRLTGTVDDLYGNQLVSVTYSNLSAKQRVAGWLDALALATGRPDENWTVHSIGKHRAGSQIAMVAPLAEPQALDWLRDLVALRDLGLSEPLPLPLRTSLAYAEELAKSGDTGEADRRAGLDWTTPRFSEGGFPKEDADAWHVLAWGEHRAYDALTGALREGEGAPPPHLGTAAAPHRLAWLAGRLWAPMLASERLRAG
ncbi:MAG: exodeoxyribonuclease V subunit gamma [Nocardioides sp.]|uniref:exodeoxyribonuclease V subunit gamma n=1 Tax=Nocardioides sp. TaxID=35761 RepID=UPI003F0E1F12